MVSKLNRLLEEGSRDGLRAEGGSADEADIIRKAVAIGCGCRVLAYLRRGNGLGTKGELVTAPYKLDGWPVTGLRLSWTD